MHRRKGLLRPMLIKATKAILARAENSQAPTGASLVRNVIRLLFDLAGFALLTIAAFHINCLTGLIVSGVICFILARHLTSNSEKETKVDPLMRT